MTSLFIAPDLLLTLDLTSLKEHLPLVLTIISGAIGYCLIQYGLMRSRPAVAIGAWCLLVVVCKLLLTSTSWDPESLVRLSFSTLAIAGGMGFLVAKEPVHAALGFATAVLSTCGLMFLESAYFIAAATIIVYAGATIIIFLFVLMFAQQTNLQSYDTQPNQPFIAAIVTTIFLIATVVCLPREGALETKIDQTRPFSLAQSTTMQLDTAASSNGSQVVASGLKVAVPSKTAQLGRSMFTDYLLAVELAGTVLLVATIGAIVLAEKPGRVRA